MQSLVEMQNHYNLENDDDGRIFTFSSKPSIINAPIVQVADHQQL